MSFCPTKDIHSVYLDNEMPEIYKAEYESHVRSCPKCSAELQKLKKLREILGEDSASVTPDKQFLDDSFERLCVKMNYAKNTGKNKKSAFGGIKYIVPAAAAAAVLALIIPVRIGAAASKNGETASSQIASVFSQLQPATNVSAVSMGSGNTRGISGNMNASVLTPHTGQSRSFNRSGSTGGTEQNLLKEVDVFRPEFNEDKTISIKITVPGMDMIPVTTEIELPMDMSSLGQY